jgi:hypothetical protein
MAVVAMTAPVEFTYSVATRLFTDAASMSAYVAAGASVPDTTITSAQSVGLTRVRLWLAVTVPSDSTWTTAGNFTITPSGGAAAVTVSSAAVGHDGSYIDLTTTAHTASGAYSVAWAGLTGITAGSDAYTPVALATGARISISNGATGNVVVGNVVAGGSINYRASDGNVVEGNAAFLVVT